DLGPADARDAALAEAHRASREDAETLDAVVLLRFLERELQPEADSEHGPALVDTRAQDVVEPAGAQAAHRGRGRADAREDGEVRRRGVAADLDAEPFERELDGANIARAVFRSEERRVGKG